MWDPAQYEKFKAQRARPFHDLVALIRPDGLRTAVDLGCGTGELTRELADRLQVASVIGVDSSPEMLAQSARWARPGLTFQQGDIAAFQPGPPLDLLFSNAALHWLPDHETVIPRLLGWVRPGGQVALQMPANFDHPSHRVARDVAARLFPDTFAPQATFAGTLAVERYAELLFAGGFQDQSCRVEVYGHPMPSGAEVVAWTQGTALTAYQARLSAPDFARFLDAYRAELLSLIGEGPYFYAFKRILLWGQKV